MCAMDFDPAIHQKIAKHPHPLVFATISGVHLYGFPSSDSDYDLRGVHVLPVRDLLSLDAPQETIEASGFRGRPKIDLVTHDVRKFFGLMLRKNGYVLEQLYSPLVVHMTPEYEELKMIGCRCVTRHHAHHYLEFSRTQWSLFQKEARRRIRPLLYVYRVLLTGIHLMRTGEIEANLVRLNQVFGLPYVGDLVARKLAGPEQLALRETDCTFYHAEFVRLQQLLTDEFERSHLPEVSSARGDLNDLLLRLRGHP